MKGLTFLKGVVVGVLVGAGLMYFLDPVRGPRRRAVVQEAAAEARQQSEAAVESVSETAQDLGQRAQDVVAETKSVASSLRRG